MERILTQEQLLEFRRYLIREEKSAATVEKYTRDVRAFAAFLGGGAVTKNQVLRWKAQLAAQGYSALSANSMLASLNSLLELLGWTDCRVKNFKVQRTAYREPEKELTRDEYFRLLRAAEGKPQLQLVMQTICGTGIRVSELKYFTVEAARRGEVEIHLKGKLRKILIPAKLKKRLLGYARERGITGGPIFITRNGNPLNRSNLWRQMKNLCAAAGVRESQVFPHNLRHLFARTFYSIDKDIARLADVLGHSSIDTTRIYIMSDGEEHRRQLDRLGLVL